METSKVTIKIDTKKESHESVIKITMNDAGFEQMASLIELLKEMFYVDMLRGTIENSDNHHTIEFKTDKLQDVIAVRQAFIMFSMQYNQNNKN